MRQTTAGTSRGIRLTILRGLEDLDFADDIVLLSQRRTDMQEKTSALVEKAQSVGLRVSKKKTKHMRVKTKSEEPIKLKDENIEDVENFTYLGSNIEIDGNIETEIRIRIGKANHAFSSL